VPTSAEIQLSLTSADLDALITALKASDYSVIGPTLGEGAIVYGEIASTADLPEGWTDVQQPGKYRIEKRSDSALFGYAVGPHSWKKFLFPPSLKLWSTQKDTDGKLTIQEPEEEVPKYAFIGVRGCELAAIKVQDRVFSGGRNRDSNYTARREKAFIVAVNCGQAAETCFCVSMGTGPGVESGYDISLTELIENGSPRYVAIAGSDKGQKYLEQLGAPVGTDADKTAAREVVEKTAASITREVNTDGIKEILYAAKEDARWDDVAARCLSCTNCTMVCPTCFCHSVSETSDLQMSSFEHTREWDSCFSMEFTYTAGGVVRDSTMSRYRQWMTHKMGSWFDQFGTSGCVGCGRCIAWCPVGIDITEEAAAIRASVESGEPPAGEGNDAS
jgi:ferredoxin